MLAAQLDRRARRLDRALRAVDVDLLLGIVVLVVLRTGSEKVILAVHVISLCRSACGRALAARCFTQPHFGLASVRLDRAAGVHGSTSPCRPRVTGHPQVRRSLS